MTERPSARLHRYRTARLLKVEIYLICRNKKTALFTGDSSKHVISHLQNYTGATQQVEGLSL